MTRTPDGRGRERRTDTILPSVLSAREHGCPPPPPDRLPFPRGGHPSSQTVSAAARPAGFARFVGARRSLIGSARALAAALLAQPAQAQSNCTLNTDDRWCGVVTVGTYSNGVGFTDSDGALTDNTGDQTIAIASGNYTVSSVVILASPAGALVMGLDTRFPTGDETSLVFHIGSSTFKVSKATFDTEVGGYIWQNSGLSWSVGDMVDVRLRRTTGGAVVPVVTIAADKAIVWDFDGTAGFTLSRTVPTTAVLMVALENDDLAELPGELTVEVQAGSGYTVGDPALATVTVRDAGEVALSWDAYAPHLLFSPSPVPVQDGRGLSRNVDRHSEQWATRHRGRGWFEPDRLHGDRPGGRAVAHLPGADVHW